MVGLCLGPRLISGTTTATATLTSLTSTAKIPTPAAALSVLPRIVWPKGTMITTRQWLIGELASQTKRAKMPAFSASTINIRWPKGTAIAVVQASPASTTPPSTAITPTTPTPLPPTATPPSAAPLVQKSSPALSVGDGVTDAERANWSKVAICEEGGGWFYSGPAYPDSLGISAANWALYGGTTDVSEDAQIIVARRIQSNPPDQQFCAAW